MKNIIVYIFIILGLFFSLQTNVYAAESTKYPCTGALRPAGAKMLNFSTFNVGNGNGSEDAVKAGKVAEYFQTFDLDIIALQELMVYEKDGDEKGGDVAEDIPVEFAKRFPGQTFYYYGPYRSIMTVSKYPITQKSYREIEGKRAVLHTQIETPSGVLRVYNTHLQRKGNSQCQGLLQSLDFIKTTNTTNDEFLITGDLNLEKEELQNSCGPLPAATLFMSCTSQPCYMNGIDFVLGGLAKGIRTVQICALPLYLVDSHELYLSTIEFISGSPSVPTAIPTSTQVEPLIPIPTSIVSACPQFSKGDATCDSVINNADYLCWKTQYLALLRGETPVPDGGCKKIADFNSDSKTNLFDFAIWKFQYLLSQ